MKRNALAIILVMILLFIYAGCSRQGHPVVQLREVNGEKMLLGPVQYQDILRYFSDWRAADSSSQAQETVIRGFQKIKNPVEVVCFLGTWCSDSRHGVPPFVKTWKAAGNPEIRLKIIGVDRNLRDPQKLAPADSIRRVPTFIIKENGRELGRLVEYPESDSFARDFLNLLNKQHANNG